MFVFDEEKALHDFTDAQARVEESKKAIEEQADAFAVNRGYDDEKRKAFVAYVLNIEHDGVSAEDAEIVRVLKKYITDAPDQTADDEQGSVTYV